MPNSVDQPSKFFDLGAELRYPLTWAVLSVAISKGLYVCGVKLFKLRSNSFIYYCCLLCFTTTPLYGSLYPSYRQYHIDRAGRRSWDGIGGLSLLCANGSAGPLVMSGWVKLTTGRNCIESVVSVDMCRGADG